MFKHRTSGILITALIVIFYFWINPIHLNEQQLMVSAVAIWMISLWVLELLPLPVVAFFPLIFFPPASILSWDELAKAYSNNMIFLFFGGFLISLAIEKWNLHKRIALSIIRITGTSGNQILLGFLISTASISMWLSNTATTMMMYPMAVAVIQMVQQTKLSQQSMQNFSLSLMIILAYASNFGGLATVIGTPPNLAFNSFLQSKTGNPISFFDWMVICTPLSIVILTFLYFLLTKFLYPNHIHSSETIKNYIKNEIHQLGKIQTPEKRVLIVFFTTAMMWIFKDLLNKITPFKIEDAWIALMGGLSLFMIKSQDNKTLLDWEDTKEMSWGILFLFGGGIALANALEKVGILQMIGQQMLSFSSLGPAVILLIIIVISIFLSEVMSNIAQVIVLAPIIAGVAESLSLSIVQLGLGMTLAASCASMLPMGTPPNAIVYSSGKIPLSSMLKTGLIMNIICVILIFVFCYYFLPLVL